MELLKSNALLLSKIKTLKEIPFDFLAPENWLFHFDMSNCFSNLFSKTSSSDLTEIMARKLTTLCITLNEYPNIRYQASSQLAKIIATKLNQSLIEYKKANPDFIVHGEDASSDRDRGQLLIVDRIFDPVTPLMHEYTYQAMANDLLAIDEHGMIHYETNTEKGEKVKKEAILNSEADELWVEHRHKHIAKVISSIKERMDDILQTSSGAKLAKKKGADLDMTAMATAVKDLPQYQQTMSDLGRHVAIATMCMKEFAVQSLLDISSVEQTLSTGVDDEGNEVKGRKAVDLVINALTGHSNMDKNQKLRLLLIFLITQRPVSTDDRRQVIASARLSNADQQILANMTNLLDSNHYDDSTTAGTNSSSNANSSATKGGFLSSIFGKSSRPAEKIAPTAEGEYTDTRHISVIKQLLERTINGQLTVERFPSLGPSVPISSDSKSTAQSVRKYKGTERWGIAGGTANATSGAAGGGKVSTSNLVGGRIIAFVAGGVSYTEVRDGYELMQKEGREIIIGGSHMVTPNDYMDNVLSLNNPNAK